MIEGEPPGWAAFVAGDYNTAKLEGRNAQSAEGSAHACRAGLVLGGFIDKGPAAIHSLHGAIHDCNEALKLDPKHYFAKMSLAIALSFEGKRLKRPAYPKRAKLYIDELIIQQPNNPLGYGALAAWHSEVSAAGFFARIALGARRKHAKAYFQKALRMGAVDFPLKFEYVKFLARGNKSDRQKAIIEGKKLIAEPIELALDKILKSHCANLVRALEINKKHALKLALRESMAFNDLIPERDIARFPLEQLVPLASD